MPPSVFYLPLSVSIKYIFYTGHLLCFFIAEKMQIRARKIIENPDLFSVIGIGSNSPPMGKASTCHTARRKAKRKEREMLSYDCVL